MTMYDSLISTKIVEKNLSNPNWLFFDCRFDLNNPNKKKSAFRVSHIPKANYVSLDEDLSDQPKLGKTGRHPLPGIEKLITKFSLWGINSSIQVVVYDDHFGAHAARFWWILKWLGHSNVAVIDGGWQRWIKEKRPESKKIFIPEPTVFKANTQVSWPLTAKNVLECCVDKEICILDA